MHITLEAILIAHVNTISVNHKFSFKVCSERTVLS